jgi:cell division septation protein DedD
LSPRGHLVWLLIGVLLGAGGTMVGSSLWLQGSYVNPSIAMDASSMDDGDEDQRADLSTAAGVRSTGIENGTRPQPAGAATEVSRSTRGTESRRDITPVTIPRDDEKLIPKASANALDALTPVDGREASEGEALLVSSNALDRAPAGGGQAERKPASAGVRSPEAATIARTPGPAAGGSDRSRSVEPAAASPATSKVALADPAVAAPSVNEPEKAAAPQAPPAAKRMYRVQLAAVNNEQRAQAFWQQAQTRLPALFDDIEPMFDRREVDNRIFYRVWVGAFDGRTAAEAYCGKLKNQGQDCFVTQG